MTTEEDIARLNMHREIETEEARATPYQRIKRDVETIAARDALFDELVNVLEFYAADFNYCCILKFAQCGHRLDWDKTPVLVDDGEQAKAILARARALQGGGK